MCGFDSDFFPVCQSKSISGCFIHQAGIFGVKCFSIFCGLILVDSKSGEILMEGERGTSPPRNGKFTISKLKSSRLS